MLVEPCQKGLKSVNAKMMMSISIVERGFPVMAIIVGYEGRSTPFTWSNRAEYLARTIRRILEFCNCDLFPSSCLLSCNSPEATRVEMFNT
jgi:hypothetical protein